MPAERFQSDRSSVIPMLTAMHEWDALGLDLRTLLERVESAPPVDAVDIATEELSRMLGAGAVSLLLADYSGRVLVRLGQTAGAEGARTQGTENAESVPLAGTLYEQVLRTQQVVVREVDDGVQVTAPVTVRGDVIGAMDLVVATRPSSEQLVEIARIGHLLGHVVVINRRYTDLFEWGQRTTAFSLSAEIQRRLLPPAFTCEAGQFTLAGWLEPASTVGGDTFDYSLERGTLHLSITDAAGHDVQASILATVLVSALRNARRAGMDLGAQVESANNELSAHSPTGWFVTGQVVRIDLERQTAAIVNAGHPVPLRLRDGQVEEIELAVDLPFGLEPGRAFREQPLALRPGDRIVFVTDGMLERHAADLDVKSTLRATAHLHPREVVHALGAAVLRITDGELRDDATVLCLDWYGGSGRSETKHGASQRYASPSVERPLRNSGGRASARRSN